MNSNSLHKRILTIWYIIIDVLAAVAVWFCFFSYRKYTELDYRHLSDVWQLIFSDYNFYLGITVIPFCWFILYALYGTYSQVWRKSRLKELITTFQQLFIGSLVLFFAIIIDDIISDYTDYIRLFLVLFSLQFGFTIILRMIFISVMKNMIRSGKIQFNALIVGTPDSAEDFYRHKLQKTFGSKVIGYAGIASKSDHTPSLRYLGSYKQLGEIIKKQQIEEVIIANDTQTRGLIQQILPLIGDSQVLLKILPSAEDHVLRTVKNTSLFDGQFIQIYLDSLPVWQKICKRSMDVFFSALFILIASPLYLFLAWKVKKSSHGDIFFRQERVGKGGKPFNIIKFRSMYADAEADGVPQLSSKDDRRITPFGVFMRRTHLDEIPQFFNVLKGDMSLVGPRPERQFYITQIVKKAPYYRLLLLEKPGVTSWGQLSYGYAENVEEMIERLQYDVMYIENISLALDIKILFYTVIAVFKRQGR
jgi:exopolysaccharide biosynthesis polyprenyl glycosylphosphotransferase